MDIHRCRFVPYPPHSINALAFSHPPNPDKSGHAPTNLRLALGRANGNIELWNPLRGAWVQETIIRGGKDRTIEGLAWIQDPEDETGDLSARKRPGRLRLFSIGYSALVTEWDLETAMPARHANSNFGEIWCLSAQPQWKPRRDSEGNLIPEPETAFRGQYLAAGCSDGTIVLLTTQDGDLSFLRTIGRPPTKRPRILSMAWKDRNTIVAGYADSTIRVFDIRSKAILRQMTLGKPQDGGSDILIWCVKCLTDGTIISGDSTGELKIWDSKNYSLFQRIMAHQADILDLAANGEGTTIITGGADRRTTIFKLMGGKSTRGRRRWAQAMHRRYHQHDVKTLAVFESKELSVCVSGGLDTIPVVMPLQEWQTELHRSLSNLPQLPQISSAPTARFFAVWWDREIHIWRMRNMESLEEGNYGENSQLMAQIRLTDEANISSAQLSCDGQLLAVSTNESVKLFQLRRRKKVSSSQLRIRKIDLPKSVGRRKARMVTFSPDSRWLCVVGSDCSISMLRLAIDVSTQTTRLTGPPIDLSRPRRDLSEHRMTFGSLGDYERTINRVTFSTNSNILAVADISGCIDTWVLEGLENEAALSKPLVNGVHGHENPNSSSSDESDGSEDEKPRHVLGQQWIRTKKKLPTINAPLLFLTFRPSKRQAIKAIENGDVSLPSTQDIPYPHSHHFPPDSETLIAVTGRHQILEFDLSDGKLSDWSKRNPMSCLPYEFRQIKDRAIGGFWDVNDQSDRLWLYGPSWLFMFDLSQDFDETDPADRTPNTVSKRPNTKLGKRKRLEASVERPTRNTGAGDAARESDRYSMLGATMKKYVNAENDIESVDLVRYPTPTFEDDDDGNPSGDLALALLRRQADDADGMLNESGAQRLSPVNGHHANKTDLLDKTKAVATPPRYWHTYQYRSIVGLVPISDPAYTADEKAFDVAVDNAKPQSNLEVVLVERPEWDLELPPRFDDGRDWAS